MRQLQSPDEGGVLQLPLNTKPFAIADLLAAFTLVQMHVIYDSWYNIKKLELHQAWNASLNEIKILL